MRTSFAIIVLLALLVGGTYWYSSVGAVCRVPIAYSVGSVDTRFGITSDEARVAIADAESIWESATGKNLFTYDPEASFEIRFIFDERQAFSDAERTFRERLDASQGVNDAIGETYATLVERYSTLHAQYEDMSETFERKLASYNRRVAEYNREGGAPPDVYASLEEEKKVLDAEAQSINDLSKRLNTLVDDINELSEQGNKLVESYNEDVSDYNRTFGTSREFTQGDYRGDSINIYTFADINELRLVLAHELGHALSLDHVADETAILYHLLGEQPEELRLTEDDLNEFERVCGATQRSWIERLLISFGI